MAVGYSVIPLDDENLGSEGFIQFLTDDGLFFPDPMPHGRFPTLTELRQVLHQLGYKVEEGVDWYVSSENDFTEIWFRGDDRPEDRPIVFWFRRGGSIVLHITQAVANLCGGFIVLSESSSLPVLLLSDDAFPAVPPKSDQSDFYVVVAHRLPAMIASLADASTQNALFILSQIRQALRAAEDFEAYERQYAFFQTAQIGLPNYDRLLNHEDARVRYLAFDLVARFREAFFEQTEYLRNSIENEPEPTTKARMIDAIEHLVVRSGTGSETDPWTKPLLDMLLRLSDDAAQFPPVRLAATHLSVRAQPGLLTPSMRAVLTGALIRPEQYELRWVSASSVVRRTLQSIEKLMLNHRIAILLAALPNITIADDAHTVLCAVLDHGFFGAIRPTAMSTLPDGYPAERPEVDETRFRSKYSAKNWLYHSTNPMKLTGEDLQPMQRQILETVLAFDIPWMVHSNLLEKYGLPPTRAEVRALLDTNQ